MSTSTGLDVVTLIKAGLAAEVKKRVADFLMKKHLAEFEADLRPRVEALVAEIIFDKVEGFKDVLRLRDELAVGVHWAGSDPVVKVG